MSYTFDDIWTAAFEGSGADAIKLSYDSRETGWGLWLPDGNAVITNTPLTPKLCLLDVVTVEYDPLATAADVLWRGFARKTRLKYPKRRPTPEWYGKIWHACRDQRLGCEGFVDGLCAISHHADTDVEALLAEADIDVSRLLIRTLKPGQPL